MLLIVTIGFSQEHEKLIKSTIVAEYDPIKSGVLKRSIALKEKKSVVELFDDKNNLIQYDEFNISTKKILTSNHLLNYKDNNATLIEIYNNQNIKTGVTQQILNSKNQIDSSFHYSNTNGIFRIQVNHYDSNGNLRSHIDSSLLFKRTLLWKYEYNDKNEMIRQIAYDENGNLKNTRTYKYDSAGKEIESDLLTANGKYSFSKSLYNENGDLTDNIWYDKNGSTTNHRKFQYEYDKHKNWITKKRLKDSEVNYIWERKIEYFD